MSAGQPTPLIVHGWTIFAHPLFLAQMEALTQQVESFKQKYPTEYLKKNASKPIHTTIGLPEYVRYSCRLGLQPSKLL